MEPALTSALLALLALITCQLHVSSALCAFPKFLWRDAAGDADQMEKLWRTKRLHADFGPTFRTEVNIRIREFEVVAKRRRQTPGCGSHVRCRRDELVFRRRCEIRLAGNRFVVREGNDRNPRFTCVQFTGRSESVISVATSALISRKMSENLCQDSLLKRDPWPWIANRLETWVACPLLGGFDTTFHVLQGERHEQVRLCPEVLKPTRLECECVMADGLQLFFPHRNCSPFHSPQLVLSFECWAHWTEGEQQFVIMSRMDEHHARYTMILPSAAQLSAMSATLVSSAFTPLDVTELASPRRVVIAMNRSVSGSCYDESPEECERIRRDGRCGTERFRPIRNVCRRSCGACELGPSPTAECALPLWSQGGWTLHERRRSETVTVARGQMTFELQGKFICKNKHYRLPLYKALSYYSNGCRPRYTCIEMPNQEFRNVLRYRISASWREDFSFGKCAFSEDRLPVADSVRSSAYKYLFQSSGSQPSSCGLGGLLQVNAVLSRQWQHVSCQASLSDWSPFTCSASPWLIVSFRKCTRNITMLSRQFRCDSLLKITANHSLLITSHAEWPQPNIRFSCWLFEGFGGFNGGWRYVYLLDRGQCGSAHDLDAHINKPTVMSFQIRNVPLEKNCVNVVTSPSTTRRQYRYHVDSTSPRTYAGASRGGNSSAGTSRDRLSFAIAVPTYFILMILMNTEIY